MSDIIGKTLAEILIIKATNRTIIDLQIQILSKLTDKSIEETREKVNKIKRENLKVESQHLQESFPEFFDHLNELSQENI